MSFYQLIYRQKVNNVPVIVGWNGATQVLSVPGRIVGSVFSQKFSVAVVDIDERFREFLQSLNQPGVVVSIAVGREKVGHLDVVAGFEAESGTGLTAPGIHYKYCVIAIPQACEGRIVLRLSIVQGVGVGLGSTFGHNHNLLVNGGVDPGNDGRGEEVNVESVGQVPTTIEYFHNVTTSLGGDKVPSIFSRRQGLRLAVLTGLSEPGVSLDGQFQQVLVGVVVVGEITGLQFFLKWRSVHGLTGFDITASFKLRRQGQEDRLTGGGPASICIHYPNDVNGVAETGNAFVFSFVQAVVPGFYGPLVTIALGCNGFGQLKGTNIYQVRAKIDPGEIVPVDSRRSACATAVLIGHSYRISPFHRIYAVGATHCPARWQGPDDGMGGRVVGHTEGDDFVGTGCLIAQRYIGKRVHDDIGGLGSRTAGFVGHRQCVLALGLGCKADFIGSFKRIPWHAPAVITE